MREGTVQSAVIDYLYLKKHFFVRLNNFPAYDTKSGGFRRMPKGTMKGLPDIMVITDGGYVVFLEIKSDKGRLSEYQKEFKLRCDEKGSEYYLIRDVCELKELGL